MKNKLYIDNEKSYSHGVFVEGRYDGKPFCFTWYLSDDSYSFDKNTTEAEETEIVAEWKEHYFFAYQKTSAK